MQKFIHVGMPKTLTSSLQLGFYPSHEEIYYLGVGNGSLIDFLDDDINFIFETLLLYAKTNYYNKYKNSSIETINNHINNAKKNSKKAFGISSEWLSFTLSPDMIDNSMKVERLHQLFGDDTKVILFMRNQKDLIKSLYGQYIQEGLSLNFSDFIDYIYNFKDRNFYYDMFYDKQLENYLRFFKKENIYFLPIENYRNNKKQLIEENGKICLIEKICNILKIEYPKDYEIPHANPTLTDQQLQHKLELNKKYRHDFGNLIFEHSNIHRVRKYLAKEKASNIPDYFKDIKVKRLLLEQAKSLAKCSQNRLSYKANEETLLSLQKEFERSNKNLIDQYGIKLPKNYFEMNFLEL